MGLVDYSDSDDEPATPPAKKRKASENDKKDSLPPLPATFRDLYSSTVRTSTQDDPNLHGGRKRVTPHVVGNWPSHVYLEWCPPQDEHALFMQIVDSVRQSFKSHQRTGKNNVHSLLENDLGVHLPLHISLSRPMALKTDQKDEFASKLETAISASSIRTFPVVPLNLIWHANEDRTRWFLVVRLQRPPGDELRRLLALSNNLAGQFQQPLLYEQGNRAVDGADAEHDPSSRPHDSFHISIAWSLHPHGAEENKDAGSLQQAIPDSLLQRLGQLNIDFADVKLRIGQEVKSIPLAKRRTERQQNR